MNDKDKHKDNRQEDLNSYHKDNMSDRERNAFEKERQKDPFLDEALEGLSTLSEAEREADLAKLNISIKKRLKKRVPVFYRIAAVVVVLMGISSIFLIRELREPELMADSSSPLRDTTQLIENEVAAGIVDDTRELEEPAKELRVEELPFEAATIQPALGETERKTETQDDKLERVSIYDSVKLAEENLAEISELILDEKVEIYEEAESVEENKQLRGVSRAKKEAELKDKAMPSISQPAGSAYKMAIDKGGVKGRVLDSSDKLPLPGVSINIKGTSKGVNTDSEGYFSIDADTGDILVARFIGMETKELKLGEGYIDEILLNYDVASLDEVVVVAYGKGDTRRKETDAVTSIVMDDEEYYQGPYPTGGMVEFRSYIKEKQIFPPAWTTSEREVVRIKFEVNTEGTPGSFIIIKSPDKAFSDEAIRLIKSGSQWIPAKVGSNPIIETVNLRIVFRR